MKAGDYLNWGDTYVLKVLKVEGDKARVECVWRKHGSFSFRLNESLTIATRGEFISNYVNIIRLRPIKLRRKFLEHQNV